MLSESMQLQMLLQKVRQYPLSIQQKTLRLYLLYVLRHDSNDDMKLFCKDLLGQNAAQISSLNSVSLGNAVGHQIHDEAKIELRISKRLDKIIDEISSEEHSFPDVYAKLSVLENLCRELRLSVKEIAEKTKRSENLTTFEMLNKITVDATFHEEAMLHTAQVLFDRIFESVNPEMAESYLDQSVLQVGPLKKAALFDAAKDKYNQLLEYHQNGNFMRDYKVTYKQYLRKRAK